MLSKEQFSTHRDALVQSGIAERMIETLKKSKGAHDPEITFGVEDCDFRVEQTGKEKEPDTYRDALVQSGIAERMIEILKKYKSAHDPEITFGVEDCGFRVKQTEKGRKIIITIYMPTGFTQNFAVKGGESFGPAGEQPLTQEQFGVIQNILGPYTEPSTKAIIEMPTGFTRFFRVEEGKPFGAFGEQPLTQEQFEVIQNILKG